MIVLGDWCTQWGMELNPSKTKSIIFSRSRTVHPEHPTLSLGTTLIDNVQTVRLLGVTFDTKVTFESHLRSVTGIVSQKIGIMRKCWQMYRDNSLVLKCFYSFILPFFEYCSSVWMSAAASHINMLERVFASARFLAPANIKLDHRRDVAASCLLFKILNNPDHPMHSRLPPPIEHARRTRRAQQMNSRARTSAVTQYITIQ